MNTLVKFCLVLTLGSELAHSTTNNVSLVINSKENKIRLAENLSFLILAEGDDLDVTCLAVYSNDDDQDHHQDHDLNWYLPDSLLNRVEPEKGENSYRIVVKNISASDRGPMTCTARPHSAYHSELVEDEERLTVKALRQKVILQVRPISSGQCGSNFFECSLSSLCIIRRYVCDGLKDCPGGEDESESECGPDPCHAKLKCDDNRCMDPSLCCIPQVHSNCTQTPACCRPIIDSINHIYHLGVEKRKENDIKYLHTTVYIVIGCVMTFIALIALVTVIICRLHIRRNQLDSRHNIRRRPFVLYDMDFLYSLLQRHHHNNNNNEDNNGVNFGINFNINNGVQILNHNNNNNPPPPYIDEDLPPPYGEQEQNNNGDINGNSDYMDQNLAQQQQQPNAEANGGDENEAGENEILLPMLRDLQEGNSEAAASRNVGEVAADH